MKNYIKGRLKDMKNGWKRAAAGVLTAAMAAGLALGSPVEAYAAAESAASLEELAEIVTAHGLKRESSFDVTYTGADKDLDELFDAEGDFFDSTLTMHDDPSTSDDADYLAGMMNWEADDTLSMKGDTLYFNLKYFDTLEQTRYVNEQIPQILSELGVAGMGNYEKVVAVHDYICKLITYSSTGADAESSVYGALVDHKALCNGYALCMYKFLVEAGVPCKFIGGKAGTGRDSGAHAWNIVALGDRWYNVDLTWDDDDEAGSFGYDYFLKGSTDFDAADPGEVHTMDKPYRTGAFAAAFPIAKTAFDPKTMSDENHSVTIGGNGGALEDSAEAAEAASGQKTYKIGDLVEGKYPSSGTFAVKKGKKQFLQLYIKSGMDQVVSKVTYKVTAGKACVKSIKNEGLCTDEESGLPFTELSFKGKKKGKVSVKIVLKLKNGQSLGSTFKGKVK